MPLILLDSGLLSDLPVVGPPVEAWRMVERAGCWRVERGFGDTLGHGSACAALLRALLPTAPLVSVAIFDHWPQAEPERFFAALRWAIRRRAAVINLSLGFIELSPSLQKQLRTLCDCAARAGTRLVAAVPADVTALDPRAFEHVTIAEAEYEMQGPDPQPVRYDRRRFLASPLPLPLPGVSWEADFHGPSLAAVRVSAYLWRELYAVACE